MRRRQHLARRAHGAADTTGRTLVVCLIVAALTGASSHIVRANTTPTTRGATAPTRGLEPAAVTRGVTALRDAVARSPVLSAAAKARYEQRLGNVTTQSLLAAGLQQGIARDTALLSTLDTQRAAASAGIDRLQREARDNLRAFNQEISFATAAVSATARSIDITATTAITKARLDVQVRTDQLVLNVQASARVLSLLVLDTRTRVDTQRLTSHLNALAQGVRLNLGAALTDLRVLSQSDASAASDAREGLATGLSSALTTLTDSLVGTIDARESVLRLDIAHLQRQETGILGAGAVALSALQHDVLLDEVSAAPLSDAQRRGVSAAAIPVDGSLRAATAVSARLAGRLADLGALQDAQARVNREVQKAQADLDGLLARTDADLQGRLRSDITIAISSTEQTVQVHLSGIQVDALVRDLDFNVRLGLSVLQIAALHAEVTPSTHNNHGSAAARIQGVDLVLHARLRGLQARIRTDVDAVRVAQTRLSDGVRARMASLRATLATTLAPLIARYQADSARLQGALDGDIATAGASIGEARARLTTLESLGWVQGRVIVGDGIVLHIAPSTGSRVVGTAPRDEPLPLIGYVWGWTVRNPRTGRSDARWYVLYNPRGAIKYMYASGAFLRISRLTS